MGGERGGRMKKANCKKTNEKGISENMLSSKGRPCRPKEETS
jgi:hypothetical protein